MRTLTEFIFRLAALPVITCAGITVADEPKVQATNAASLLAPYFNPPGTWEKPGAFRSPLLFDDGTRVQTAKDWPRRREEILKYWDGVMGPWPPLLAKPAALSNYEC